jgi:hypothetical protein
MALTASAEAVTGEPQDYETDISIVFVIMVENLPSVENASVFLAIK